MRVAAAHEEANGRRVHDVHEKNLGYDLTGLDLESGELRLIEVKGLAAATGSVLLTPNERRVAEDRRDSFTHSFAGMTKEGRVGQYRTGLAPTLWLRRPRVSVRDTRIDRK